MAKPKRKSWKEYTAFGSISAEWILRNLPFVFFLGFLTTMYIANSHYAEGNVRQIQMIQKDIKDLRREYNSLKAEIMFKQKLSEVEKSVENLDLELPKASFKKIEVRE